MKEKLIELRDYYKTSCEKFDKLQRKYRDDEMRSERYCILEQEYSVFVDKLNKIINQ